MNWGVDSEFGRLLDVLVCRPDHFRWLPTSAISRATLDSGARFDPEAARDQHDQMISAYETAGVQVHFLDTDPALPYQVFARDSAAMTPKGAIVTQLQQWWRRGEYAPVINFLEKEEIPTRGMITAAALEGGDVVIVEPGVMLIGHGEERTQSPAAGQLASWMEDDGWEVRIEPIPGKFVHLDVLVSIPAPRLAVVCTDACPGGLTKWLTGKGFEILEVSAEDSLELGVNVMSLGDDRVISAAGSSRLNDELRANGFDVRSPDLSMFTRGGGGAHCLAQALRREPMG